MKHYIIAAAVATTPALAQTEAAQTERGKWALALDYSDFDFGDGFVDGEPDLGNESVGSNIGLTASYFVRDSIAVSLSHSRPNWDFDNIDNGANIKNEVSLTSLLATKYFFFGKPYALVGAGYNRSETTYTLIGTDEPGQQEYKEDNLTWQLGGGYAFNENIFVELKYRDYGEIIDQGRLSFPGTATALSLGYRF